MLELNTAETMIELDAAEINEVSGGVSLSDIYEHSLTTEFGRYLGGKIYDWTH